MWDFTQIRSLRSRRFESSCTAPKRSGFVKISTSADSATPLLRSLYTCPRFFVTRVLLPSWTATSLQSNASSRTQNEPPKRHPSKNHSRSQEPWCMQFCPQLAQSKSKSNISRSSRFRQNFLCLGRKKRSLAISFFERTRQRSKR